MFKIQKMRAARNRKTNQRLKKINMLMFNKAKASQKRLRNIQKWPKM